MSKVSRTLHVIVFACISPSLWIFFFFFGGGGCICQNVCIELSYLLAVKLCSLCLIPVKPVLRWALEVWNLKLETAYRWCHPVLCVWTKYYSQFRSSVCIYYITVQLICFRFSLSLCFFCLPVTDTPVCLSVCLSLTHTHTHTVCLQSTPTCLFAPLP